MRCGIGLNEDAGIQVQDAEVQNHGDDDRNSTGSEYLILGDDDGHTADDDTNH